MREHFLLPAQMDDFHFPSFFANYPLNQYVLGKSEKHWSCMVSRTPCSKYIITCSPKAVGHAIVDLFQLNALYAAHYTHYDKSSRLVVSASHPIRAYLPRLSLQWLRRQQYLCAAIGPAMQCISNRSATTHVRSVRCQERLRMACQDGECCATDHSHRRTGLKTAEKDLKNQSRLVQWPLQ